ncbi:MAG: hypothetical protein OXC02_00140 [Rhodobacteraceae bacterium]|nr:hypothetical protein [Paracoccaceae bacterium]
MERATKNLSNRTIEKVQSPVKKTLILILNCTSQPKKFTKICLSIMNITTTKCCKQDHKLSETCWSNANAPQIAGVPKLVNSKKYIRKKPLHEPQIEYGLNYKDKHHPDLPHIVKFSGGRSSGMLLLTLLCNQILDAKRGDVVIFNNTSCEHPYTYDFVKRCKKVTENFGIPFFIVEFITYEDSRRGEWARFPSYRLTNENPISSDNPNGFHWKGEVFEELISWSGFIPNQFSRICTKRMKLETTRYFLQDWFTSEDAVQQVGHFDAQSRIDHRVTYLRHLRNGGSVPEEIFFKKKRFVWSRPHFRQEQKYLDFSSAWIPFVLPKKSIPSNRSQLVSKGFEYVSFIGLRGDEKVRVNRVKERNSNLDAYGFEGEHIYLPLDNMNISKEDVNVFWSNQEWDLNLPMGGGLSNCVYCFLKGAKNLRGIHAEMERMKHRGDIPNYGSIENTPCDLEWWKRIERDYGRDLLAENRKKSNNEINFLGFFGNKTGFNYELLSSANDKVMNKYIGELLPCDCTE